MLHVLPRPFCFFRHLHFNNRMDNTADFGVKMGKTSLRKKIIYSYSFGEGHKVTTILVLPVFVFYSDPALKCS